MTYPTIMPALTLDFVNSQQLDNRIAFSRSTIGTYVDSSGLIKTAPVNVARFDHDSTGKPLGLLIEESRTNNKTNSQDFSSGWNRSGVAVVTQDTTIVTPYGSTDSTGVGVLTESSGGTVHQFYAAASSQVTKYITYSVFAKPNGRNHIQLQDGPFAHDLVNGTTSGSATGEYVSATTTKLANGWCRCTMTRNHSNTYDQFNIKLHNGSGASYSGDGSSGVYIWGVQQEDSSFVSSYIQTESSTVNRSADVAQITGDQFSSWYNANQGTFYVDIDTDYGDVGSNSRILGLSSGGTWRTLQWTSAPLNVAGTAVRSYGGSSEGVKYHPISPSPFGKHRIALSYDTADSMSVDGAAVQTGTTGQGYSSASDAIELRIFRSNTTMAPNNNSYGHISRLSYYNERLTDAELQQITK
jgi:hypothetical protein